MGAASIHPPRGSITVSQHPANLALRFLLELIALWGMGAGGWSVARPPALGLALPLLAAALWGVLRVPGDPGDAPVAVPGGARLLLEALFFAAGVWGFARSGWPLGAAGFGAVVLVHYAFSLDRVARLLGRR